MFKIRREMAINKASSDQTRFYPIVLFTKGVQWKSQTTQTAAKEIICTLQTEQCPLLKTTSTHPFEYVEVEMLPAQNLHNRVLVSMKQKTILWATQREKSTPIQPQNLLSTLSSLKICQGNSSTNLVVAIQQQLICFPAHSMKLNTVVRDSTELFYQV